MYRVSAPFRERVSPWRRWRRDLLLALAAGALGLGLGAWLGPKPEVLVTRSRPLMGTLMEIRLPGPLDETREAAVAAAFAEMARVERLLAPYRPGGGPASAAESLEVRQLLELGRQVGAASLGAVDLRIRDWVELWGFESTPRKPSQTELDSMARRRAQRPASGDWREFSFGCVAAGYAVDRALLVLKDRGLTRVLVNAGGEVGVLGQDWSVGVQDPRDSLALLARVTLDEGQFVATSGDYQSAFEAEGRRWHHLLQPATGLPASECQSVSVRAPSCAEADIWATALFVMGPAGALALAQRHPELEVLVVDAEGQTARSAGWDAPVRRK